MMHDVVNGTGNRPNQRLASVLSTQPQLSSGKLAQASMPMAHSSQFGTSSRTTVKQPLLQLRTITAQ